MALLACSPARPLACRLARSLERSGPSRLAPRAPKAHRRWLARLSPVPALALLAVTAGLAGPRPAAAFDIDAHDAVGQTTASAMDQDATKQLKRLLGGIDASDAAGWGHQADDTYPGMERLHFQVQSDSPGFCADADKQETKCVDGICLMTAIKHFYGKILADEGRKTEYPAIDYNKAAAGVTFSDADSVKMLMNLLGDLHQPMHVGWEGDDMGRKVQVIFKGKTMSLYDLWDKGISEEIRTTDSNFWLGGWTHVGRVSRDFDRDKQGWKDDGATATFDKWHKESVNFACKTAYKHPITGKMLAGPDAEAGPVEIDDAAYEIWKHAWLRQILIAGERTAVVMNDILDAKSAAKLQEGSSVHTKADDAHAAQLKEWEKEFAEDRKKHPELWDRPRGSKMDMGAFLTNLMIAAVIVPLIILMLNYGVNPQAWVSIVKGLTASAKSGQGSGPRDGGKRWN